jgi:hypothetical protein
MDSDKLVVESDIKKTSFMEHVFNFDDDSKSQLLNIVQYTVIAIVPVVLLIKGVAKLIPEVDEEQSSYMLVVELLGQSLLMFLGMFLIHRFVTYFKTYSGVSYAPFHTTNIIMLFLVIAASFQTRIGEKTNILIDRLFDLIEGRSKLSAEEKKEEKGKGKKVVAPQHQASRADVAHAGTTHISQLQSDERGNGMPAGPNFNNMFAGPNNPLQNAHTPGQQIQEPFVNEPVAANEMGSSMWNAY